MNQNSTHTELLIQFLDGELQGDRLADVKESIKNNAATREELENLLLAQKATKNYGLKTRINSIHTDMMKEMKTPATPVSRRILQYSIRIAAVIMVMFALSFAYQYMTATPAKLFDESFRPYELQVTRGGSITSKLEDLYEEGNLKGLIEQYNLIKSPQAKDCFLAGNAMLSKHQPADAITTFVRMQQINKSNNTHYYEDDVEYFLGLAYLANNEPTKALPLFEKIHKDPNHPFNTAVSSWFLSKVNHSISAK
jgi:hypothetical protein